MKILLNKVLIVATLICAAFLLCGCKISALLRYTQIFTLKNSI